MGGTVSNTLKEGGTEKRGGQTKIFKVYSYIYNSTFYTSDDAICLQSKAVWC